MWLGNTVSEIIHEFSPYSGTVAQCLAYLSIDDLSRLKRNLGWLHGMTTRQGAAAGSFLIIENPICFRPNPEQF